jgi:hypothetical protein
MATEPGTLQLIGQHLTLALKPLSAALTDKERFRGLMYQLGWRADDLPPAYAALGTSVDAAATALDALSDDPTPQEILTLIEAVQGAYDAIRSITVAPPGVDAAEFLGEIGERLFELLLTEYLAAALPAVHSLLQALDVIDVELVPATATRPSFARTRFKWEEIPKIVSEPNTLPARVYGWGTPVLEADRIMHHLAGLSSAIGFPVRTAPAESELDAAYTDADEDDLAPSQPSLTVPFYYIEIAGSTVEAAVVIRELPAAGTALPGIVIEPKIPSQFPLTIRLADNIAMRLLAGTNIATTLGILIRPDGIAIKYPFEPGTTPPSAGLGIGFDFTPAAPTLLIGSPKQSRLEFKGGSIDFAARSVNGEFDAILSGQLKGLSLVLTAGEGDGFIQKILGDGETRVEMTLGVEWSRSNGLRFSGSGAFEVALHPHLSLGPISIDEIDIRLAIPSPRPPDLRLELAAVISGELGPLTFFVQGIGIKVDAEFSPGNMGPLDLDLGFKPPTGVGLAIDGGGFTGGGFLIFDPDKGEYAGGLELEFQGTIAVKAIGLLNTRMPDGSRGFSLLIIISAEFAPIQLSFGFTLLGVGGLLGINRTVVYDVLRSGLRDGSLQSILFPQDVVANAPRILNDLRRIFPPLDGRFLIGPMAKLGWGTPTLISLEIGLLLEIPRPALAILGVLRVALPGDDVALLSLQVNFLGVIDFGKGQLSFDASLFDSHILTFALTGDMAVRVYWSANANLLLTVGGFHPAYVPPPMDLPALRRLSIDIFPKSPRLHAESYFAVTSNTIQFGAKVELSAGASVFNIYGFMAFDVLIRRKPFHFIAEFSAMLAVRSGGSTLFGVRVDATLEGPAPWHAHGKGSFEIGFVFTITISVHFDVTVGDARTTTLPPVQVFGILVEALTNPGNWRAVLPQGATPRVSVRELPPSTQTLVLHPFGTLEASQKVVPLNLAISRFGAQTPEHGTLFRIESVTVGTDTLTPPYVRDEFAPAQFFEMSDSDKLSRKSFESYDAGVRIGGSDAPVSDYVVSLDVVYEVIYIPVRQARTLFRLTKLFFNALIRGAAISKSSFSASKREPSVLATPKVSVGGERFGVATTRDLSLFDTALVFESEAEAHQALRHLVEADPGRRRELQVVPLYETSAA